MRVPYMNVGPADRPKRIHRVMKSLSLANAASALLITIGMAMATTHGANLHRGWSYPMNDDPRLPTAAVVIHLAPKSDMNLWIQVLQHRSAAMDLRLCSVIQTQKAAGLRLSPQLRQALIELATTPWKSPHVNPSEQVRTVAAQAAAIKLIGAYLKQHDPAMLIHLQQSGSSQIWRAVDPLLFGTHSPTMLKIWTARALNPDLANTYRLAAIRGLAAGENRATPPLLQRLALNIRAPAAIRIGAARALAGLHWKGCLAMAGSSLLKSARYPANAYIAAILTCGSENRAAVMALAQSKNTPEALMALKVIEISQADSCALLAAHAARLNAAFTHNPAPLIRFHFARICLRAAAPQSPRLLGILLGDRRRFIRNFCRTAMIQLAGDENLRPKIQSVAMGIITQSGRGNPAGEAQALLLLSRLHFQPVIAPAATLLKSPSANVQLAAVVALRRLKAPGELPAVQRFAARTIRQEFKLKTDFFLAAAKAHRPGEPPIPPTYTLPLHGPAHVDAMALAQAFIMFGQLHDARAVPMLRTMIPKGVIFTIRCREAAVWALGKIYAGQPNAPFAGALLSRLNDAYSLPPEADGVRAMAAIALARLRYKPALTSIDNFALEPATDRATFACIWAAAHLAGKHYPLPHSKKLIPRGFATVLRP